MPNWHIQRGRRVRTLDEATLRDRLRRGRYTGAELVRREGDGQWKRIFELPLYREEVPGDADPVRRAQLKIMLPLISHVLVFALVVGSSNEGGPPIWAMFWGIALFSHILRTALKARDLRTARLTSTPLPASPRQDEPSREEPLTRTPARTMSPWRTRMEEALLGLEGAARRTGRETALPDLAALRRDADGMDQDAAELDALSNPELLSRLRAELAETEARMASSDDARTVDALSGTAEAIRERLVGAEAAAEANTRLSARQAALLHQVEGLRLSFTTTRLDDSAAPDLAEQVREVRDRARASAELERQLAAARQSQRRKIGS